MKKWVVSFNMISETSHHSVGCGVNLQEQDAIPGLNMGLCCVWAWAERQFPVSISETWWSRDSVLAIPHIMLHHEQDIKAETEYRQPELGDVPREKCWVICGDSA